MVWKILSALSAVMLGTACYFAWSNTGDFKQEKDKLARAEANKKDLTERRAELEEELKTNQAQLAAAEKERDTTKDDVVKVATEAQEKEAAATVLKGNLDQVTKQVATLETKISEAGDVTKLVAQIEALKKELQSAEGALANQTQRLAQAQEATSVNTSRITGFREAEVRSRKGVVDPEFTARVSQFFPAWGFAILSKGNASGVFANADLEVKRGRNVIAKLKVRNVEQNTSVADLIPGSLAEGDSVRSGDMVVAAAQQSAATTTTAAPSEGGAAATTPAPAPDAAAPAPAPMNNDPFGAPAAPAPGAAPAPMNNDPFGAPAAPAPGAAPAPMNSDPFATPAPAAGTTPAPSTADPFAKPQ